MPLSLLYCTSIERIFRLSSRLFWSVGCSGDVAHASSGEKAAGASGTTGAPACGRASSRAQEEH